MLVVCKYDFRLGTNANQLAAVAFSRLQKEIAKDGREPNVLPNKLLSRKGSDAGASTTAGGGKMVYKFVCCFILLCRLRTEKNVL